MSSPPAVPSPGGGPGQARLALLVYCAAGIKAPVAELAARFESDYGVQVQLQYGGSGTLLSNLQVARQGDLYVAADTSYQEIAEAKGLIAEVLPLAEVRPVIAVKKGNPKGVRSLEDLLRGDVRVALGNPEAASIGKQIKDLLSQAGSWEALQARIEHDGVFKPTVAEVANDLKLGAVDAGVIWDATAAQYPELEIVPEARLAVASPTEIAVSVLRSAASPVLALRFARYLNSRVGNAVFRRHGYAAVAGDDWAWQPEITFFCGAVNRRSIEGVLRRFAEREGVTINTVYNGCGILTAQMRTVRQAEDGVGFPDVYMACDRYYLENVKAWFQEDVDISDNQIVIAVPKGNPAGIRTLDDLAKRGRRIAVGQPDQCTIGALTRILLEKEGLLEAVMTNVVTQTASSAMLVPTVTTKSVDAALAYNTDTLAESDKIDTVIIDSPHAVAIQPFSLARSSRYKHLGRRLLAAVAAARDDFEQAGFHYRLEENRAGP